MWRGQLGLGPAIGATFFTIDTGANGGQGSSSATGAAAGGLAVPVVTLGAMGLVALAGVLALF